MALLKEATKAVCMMPFLCVLCGNEHGPDGTRAIIQQLLVKLSSSKYIQRVLTQFTTTPPPTRTHTTQQRCAALMPAAVRQRGWQALFLSSCYFASSNMMSNQRKPQLPTLRVRPGNPDTHRRMLWHDEGEAKTVRIQWHR